VRLGDPKESGRAFQDCVERIATEHWPPSTRSRPSTTADHGSKWSSFEARHITHLPPSRLQTASLTEVGILRRVGLALGRALKSSSPSTAAKRNLNADRYSKDNHLHRQPCGTARCCHRIGVIAPWLVIVGKDDDGSAAGGGKLCRVLGAPRAGAARVASGSQSIARRANASRSPSAM
jgi:hypothetical protein